MTRMMLCSALALFAGCAGNETDGGLDDTGVAQANLAVGTGKNRCPDPSTDCTVLNGPGVYTDEGGFAGLGGDMYMITHFINVAGGGVQFEGIYYDATQQGYLPSKNRGSVVDALYQGVSYSVVSLSEKATVPSWLLQDDDTGAQINVGGSQLVGLQLGVETGSAADKGLSIKFTAGDVDNTHNLPVEYFNMVWIRNGKSYQYCIHNDETWSSDQVVFQGSIAVDPNTAKVTRDDTSANMVTLSCRGGAIATVHSWGYGYRTGYDPQFFDAGLQMKRDSYCADGSFYTLPGTAIQIDDSLGVNTTAPHYVEAFWSPQGALCVDMKHRRHPELGFTGKCNGVALPLCDGKYPIAGKASLEEGPAKLPSGDTP